MTMSKRISAANRVMESHCGYRGTDTMVRAMLEAAFPDHKVFLHPAIFAAFDRLAELQALDRLADKEGGR